MDSAYLKETVGNVLAEALASVAKCSPADPVQHVGMFLINHAKNQERSNKERAQAALEDAELEKLHIALRAERKKKEDLDARKAEVEEYEAELIEKLKKTRNAMDVIPDALNYIRKLSSASSVYIGRRELPEDEGDEGDEDEDEGGAGEQFIKYLATTQGDEFLEDKYLLQNQGVTFDVWKVPEKEEDDDIDEDDNEGVDSAALEPQPVHIQNVCREPRIVFFRRIPRLGAYLAVPFKYESCNSQPALDKAFASMEKTDDTDEADEAAEMRMYANKKCEMVVCLDTLGRNSPGGFKPVHVEKVKAFTSLFAGAFERSELQHLKADVELLRKQKESQKDILDLVKETYIRAEGDVSEAVEALGEDTATEVKTLVERAQRLIQAEKVLLVVKKEVLELRSFHVKPKHALIRVITALLYVLKVPPASILDHKKASWPKMRNFFTEAIFTQIHEYSFEEPEPTVSHATIGALRKLTDGLSALVLYKHSVAVGVILSWINAVLEVREANIAKKEYDREAALEAKNAEGDDDDGDGD